MCWNCAEVIRTSVHQNRDELLKCCSVIIALGILIGQKVIVLWWPPMWLAAFES
jgi:hypothetical protein